MNDILIFDVRHDFVKRKFFYSLQYRPSYSDNLIAWFLLAAILILDKITTILINHPYSILAAKIM